jgi:hypothetical protein
MSQSETDIIKAAIGDYRQFKFKFIQFVKNFEEFLSEEKLLEIKLKKSSDTTLQLSVFDSPVLVKFSLLLTSEDTLTKNQRIINLLLNFFKIFHTNPVLTLRSLA